MRRVRNVRHLADGEKRIGMQVFKQTIPYDKILISDGLGGGDRPFTVPTNMPLSVLFNVKGGKYVIHAGENGFYGLSSDRIPEDRYLLIHELTHIWQGEHSPNHTWAYVLEALDEQIYFDDPYKYDINDLKDWDDWRIEQQASIVEDWYKGGMKSKESEDLRFYYIKRHIWGEQMDHDWIRARRHPTVKPLDGGTIQINVSYPTIDGTLLQLLNKRFHADDVAGYGNRLNELGKIFGALDKASAKVLMTRIETRRSRDKVSELFYDNLSTAGRAKLIEALRKVL